MNRRIAVVVPAAFLVIQIEHGFVFVAVADLTGQGAGVNRGVKCAVRRIIVAAGGAELDIDRSGHIVNVLRNLQQIIQAELLTGNGGIDLGIKIFVEAQFDPGKSAEKEYVLVSLAKAASRLS